jgi:PAS domain S-box-containing protein
VNKILNKKYQEVFNHLPILICSIDSNGFVLNVNTLWLETMEYSKKEVIGKKFVDSLTNDSKAYSLEFSLPTIFKSGKCLEEPFQFEKQSGEKLSTLLSANTEYNEKGVIIQATFFITNVSEIQKKFSQLEEFFYLKTNEAKIKKIQQNVVNFEEFISKKISATSPCQKLIFLRINAKISQERMSEILNVSYRTYQRIEYGKSPLTTDMILIICKKLKISPHSFF